MPELSFRAGEAVAMPYTAVPTIAVPLHIANAVQDEPVQSILLACQVQIQPLGRSYTPEEEGRLLDLFGDRSCWGNTMKPLHWMNVVLRVPPFHSETTVELPLPCSLDFDVAAHKYFYGLQAGHVAVNLMFSGTVFYLGENELLRVSQIPWDREARFRLPVEIWQQAVAAHYHDAAWLRLDRETFERLYLYKVSEAIPMWEAVFKRLLDQAEGGPRQPAICEESQV